jgi:hypothetical protein
MLVRLGPTLNVEPRKVLAQRDKQTDRQTDKEII